VFCGGGGVSGKRGFYCATFKPYYFSTEKEEMKEVIFL